ncbi:hypothetical protein [Kaarinaea lacus]
MKSVNTLIIAGFALFLTTGIAGAVEMDDLEVTVRVVESDDDVNEVEHELHLPDSVHEDHDDQGHDENDSRDDDNDHEDDGDREELEDDRDDHEDSHDGDIEDGHDAEDDSSEGTESSSSDD